MTEEFDPGEVFEYETNLLGAYAHVRPSGSDEVIWRYRDPVGLIAEMDMPEDMVEDMEDFVEQVRKTISALAFVKRFNF